MITNGTLGGWLLWAFMLGASVGAALGCYRMGRRIGFNDTIMPTYGALTIVFACVAYLIVLNAPFHVSVTL